jgi:Tol biopolymer transport system component
LVSFGAAMLVRHWFVAMASFAVVSALIAVFALPAGASPRSRNSRIEPAPRVGPTGCNSYYEFCDPGQLAAGVYTTKYFLPGMKVNVPGSGWTSVQDSTTEFKLSPPGYPDPNTAPVIRFWIDPRVTTACSAILLPYKLSTPSRGVSWFTTNANFFVSGSGQATIAGHTPALTVDYDASPNEPECDPACGGPCIGYFAFFGGPQPDSTDSFPGHTPGIKDGFGTGHDEPVRLYFAHIGSPSHSHLLVVGVDDQEGGADMAALRADAATMVANLRLPSRLPPTGERCTGCFNASDLGPAIKNGEIALSAPLHGVSQVFTVRPNGTRLRQATHGPFTKGQYGLTWSNDGRSLLYLVNGNGTNRPDEMFQSAADGSGATLISPPCTGTCLGDGYPEYSPDGSRIAFERAFVPIINNSASVAGIFTMNADGSDLTQLTQTSTPTSSEDHQPQWSPDGKEIAFVRFNTTAWPRKESAIEVMNANGSDVHRLTPWSMRATDPRWSPNGTRILFNTYWEPVRFKSANLFTIHPDGTHRLQLTHYRGGTFQAFADSWSPDGREVLFQRSSFSGCCSETGGFYILNLHSRQARRLMSVPIHDHDARAAWGRSPR